MSTFPEPRLEITHSGAHTVVRITNCAGLSDFNVEALGRQLNDVVEGGSPQSLLLHLDGVDFLTSTALGKLVSLNRKLRAGGGKLTLVNPAPAVEEVLAVTRLDKLIDVQRPAGPGPAALSA